MESARDGLCVRSFMDSFLVGAIAVVLIITVVVMSGCFNHRDRKVTAGKKNGPTRLGQGQKVGFAHAPVQEQGDVKHIARGMSRDQTQRKNPAVSSGAFPPCLNAPTQDLG
jgi:hypothetical protein